MHRPGLSRSARVAHQWFRYVAAVTGRLSCLEGFFAEVHAGPFKTLEKGFIQ